MSQYQPTADTLYRIQSLAFGSYLSLTDVDEGEMPRLIGKQNAQKQYWKFIVDTSAKSTYKIVNAAPNPEDVDTLYALSVHSPGNSVATKDADTKTSVWKIGVSSDRDHCSIITSYAGQPGSKAYLQANANGAIGLYDESHRNSQHWRLIEVGSTEDTNTGPTKGQTNTNEPATTPLRIDEIPEGTYEITNILTRAPVFIGPYGCPVNNTTGKAEPPIVIHYQNDTTPYFTMKVSGTNVYIQEADGQVSGSATTPTLWYFVKTPAYNSYYICPRRSNKMKSWSGKWTEKPRLGRVYNTAYEVVQGATDDDNLYQRWWVTPCS